MSEPSLLPATSKEAIMLRSIFATLLILLFCPTEQSASHKSISRSGYLYIMQKTFEDLSKDSSLPPHEVYMKISDIVDNAKSDEEFDLLLRVAGFDFEKVKLAVNGLNIALRLDLSGFSKQEAIKITRDVQNKKPKTKGYVEAFTFWLKERGLEMDSTQVGKALRQGELLNHLELDPSSAYIENGIDFRFLKKSLSIK